MIDKATRYSTARSRVRDEVRRMILNGELQSGARLTQQHLAGRFNVAQSVVRESLLELQLSGLVESVDNVGTFVSQLDAETLVQAYHVREVLEGLAARQCCEHVSRADIRQLQEMVDRIYELGTAGKTEERGTLDRVFHRRTIEVAQNPLLSRLTDAYHVLGMVVQASLPHKVIRDQHRRIVAAIEANQPEEAEAAARSHVADARRSIERQIAEGKFVPRWVVS